MTDEDFLELIADEFKVCITKEEIPTYKKAILNCAKVLKDENKKKAGNLLKKQLSKIFLALTAKNWECLTTVIQRKNVCKE